MIIIDSHVHLWKKQHGIHNGRPVISLTNGLSDFGGEIRQMMPPYMVDGENNAEMLISNMDYAGVSAAVVTQEIIDGNQDDYLVEVKKNYPDRIRICAFYDDNIKQRKALKDAIGLNRTGRDADDFPEKRNTFDGIKLCACKMKSPYITDYAEVFETAHMNNMFVAVELADGDAQTASLLEMIQEYPDLKIIIGHFGMVTRNGWEEQIRLARHDNVYVESGGITWLFHYEFYPYPSAVRAIRTAADICGMDKLMWGSDYPRTMTDITYKMSYDFIMKDDSLSQIEKEQFFYRNAEKVYGFSGLKEIKTVKNML